MKFTPELVQKLCSHLETGHKRLDACLLCGIDESTLYRWTSENESFASAIKKAEVKFKGRLIQSIQIASQKDWRASAWLLEHKYRDEYGDFKKIEPVSEVRVSIVELAKRLEATSHMMTAHH